MPISGLTEASELVVSWGIDCLAWYLGSVLRLDLMHCQAMG